MPPVATSHALTLPSSDTLTAVRPSLVILTAYTALECFLIERASFPVFQGLRIDFALKPLILYPLASSAGVPVMVGKAVRPRADAGGGRGHGCRGAGLCRWSEGVLHRPQGPA